MIVQISSELEVQVLYWCSEPEVVVLEMKMSPVLNDRKPVILLMLYIIIS